jgi:hypothetical protein
MTKTIELEEQVANRVEELARELGISVSELVSSYLNYNAVTPKMAAYQRIKELTAGLSLSPEVDARREYNEASLRKHE